LAAGRLVLGYPAIFFAHARPIYQHQTRGGLCRTVQSQDRGVCLSSQGLTLPRHWMSSRAGRCRRNGGQEDRLPNHQYAGVDGGGEAGIPCYFFSVRSNACSACSNRSKTRRPGLLRRMGLSSSQRMLSRRSLAVRRGFLRRSRPSKACLLGLPFFFMTFGDTRLVQLMSKRRPTTKSNCIYTRFSKNSKSPSGVFFDSSSVSPELFTYALMSRTDNGSDARTRSVWPLVIVSSSFLMRMTGTGQFTPRTSRS
jgi:hypothetical protein